MKRNLLKRIGAVALAVAVSLTMGTAAFAADTVGDATNAEFETNSTTFSIPKGIVVTNPEDIKVYSPAVEYTFTINKAEGGQKITSTVEGKEGTRTVKTGEEGGLTITNTNGTVSFTAAETAATVGSLGIELTQNIDLSVDLEKFSSAGIYRYKISDTTDTDALTAAGITRETGFQADRYIDLYISNGTNGLQVSGYTVIDGDEASTDINGDTNDTTAKNAGYVSGSKTDSNGKITERGSNPADLYNTINVKLNKVVEGTMGDKQNAFPFTVDLTDVGSSYYTTMDTAANAQGTSTTATELTQALKDGESYLIKGLNPKAHVTYTEKNNTADAYIVEAAGKKSAIALTGPDAQTKEVAANGTAVTASLAVSNYEDYSTKSITPDANNEEVTYTNTLGQISPTNVVMRFAPYLFILGAAIVLLVMMRRRKAHNDADAE